MSEEKSTKKRGFAVLEPGIDFVPFEFVPKPLGDYDVAVDVITSSVCHSDCHKCRNEWVEAGANPTHYPLVPGHEVIGKIVAMGPKVDTNVYHIGDRVGFGPQRGSCNECEWCKMGEEQLCKTFIELYDPDTGGYAEHIRVDSRFAFHIPDEIDSPHAAPLLCAGITTYAPLAHYRPEPGSRVGVVGIGGLGHLALQFSRAMGYRTVSISRQLNKTEDATRFGAHEFLHSANAEEMKKNNNTFDFILVSASVSLDWKLYLDLLRPNGKLCLLGIPPEPLQIPAFSIISRRRTVCGSPIGGSRLMKEMLAFAAKHKIAPQIELIRLKMNENQKVTQAMQKMLDGEVRYRSVFEFDTSS